jgi:antitoxin (DNA-binding transcriptional repressor) of toxin-antitoxin stability system
MKRVRIGEFRDHASELIRGAEAGETIVILTRDREVARMDGNVGELHGIHLQS